MIVRFFAWLTRAVDHEFRDGPFTGAPVFLPSIIPILLVGVPVGKPDSFGDYLIMGTVLAWAVGWQVFCGGRFWIEMKLVSERNARHFDRSGKFDLPPEYADTESFEKARRGKKPAKHHGADGQPPP